MRNDTTLTIRLSTQELRRLRARAKAAGLKLSAFARKTLTEEKDEGPTLGELTREFIGCINDPGIPAGRDAREALRDWNPDRRG